MEEELGRQLIERGDRSIAPTYSGQAFFEDVAPLLEQIDESANRDRHHGERLFEEAAGLRVAHTDAAYNLKLLRQSQQLNVASVPWRVRPTAARDRAEHTLPAARVARRHR
jgi:hypothetical protein